MEGVGASNKLALSVIPNASASRVSQKPPEQRTGQRQYFSSTKPTSPAIILRADLLADGWRNFDSTRPTTASDPAHYNALFASELEKVIGRTSDAKHRQALERMRGFNWLGYVAASVRNAGFRDYRDGQERIHDVAVKLLTGTLFRGFDERRSGPMDLRFKNSVGNAVRNMAESGTKPQTAPARPSLSNRSSSRGGGRRGRKTTKG